jgi:GMP synthase (glutamine-hydrolysing)
MANSESARRGGATAAAARAEVLAVEDSTRPSPVPVRERVLILDFGSQYTHLITRRVRELGVYAETLPCTVNEAQAPRRENGLVGIVLSGGPSSVYEPGAPQVADWVLERGVPVLGVCYGQQALAWRLGGPEAVARGARGGEYGHATIERVDLAGPDASGESPLLEGVSRTTSVWMSHGDSVARLPPGFRAIATSEGCPLAAVEDPARRLFALQFHPEVTHTPEGRTILSNFLFRVCGARKSWEMKSFLEEAKRRIREQVGKGRVILGLSGGVDSSVAAVLLHEAIGDQLTCVFVDSGLLRAGEPEEVVKTFRDHFHLDLRAVDASERFLSALQGVSDPEEKRRVIGRVFVEVFEAEAKKLGDAQFLAQGTLYPDVIESVSPKGGPSHTIKTHHNVGGLPAKLGLKLVEPLRELFKDEVRELGRQLGVPERILRRHPFPGPGLAVRCLGALDAECLALLRAADRIAREELEKSGWMARTSQAFVVLLPVRSVGVQGDARTYGRVAVLRVVETEDFMTAGWARLPHELLARIATRVTNEVRGINRVVYDVTSKPPSTIEWE